MKSLLLLFFWSYRCIPLRLRRLLGILVGVILRTCGFRKKVVALHLKRVYEDRGLKTAEECRLLLKSFYRNFGLLISESLRLSGGHLDYLDTLCESEGLEHLDAAVAKGKGTLILDGHIGNWEQAGAILTRKGYSLGVIAKEMKGKLGSISQHVMRDAAGVQEFAKSNSIKGIFKALKENKVIVVMVDQNMTLDDGEIVDFFGYPACTMTSLAVIASRTGAAVIPASSYRNADGLTHQITIWPEVELESPSDDRKENVIHNTKRFNTMLEKMIEREPAQWLWIHKRWKTRPKGEETNPFPYKQL